MNEVPNRADMIDQLFRERERFADQSTATLAQRVVEAFNVVGLAARFADWSMTFRGQHGGIGLPEIAITHGALPVHCREGGPQLARDRFRACPDRHAHNLTSHPIERAPNPLLPAFLPHVRPQFITFQNQAPFFCSVMVTERGTAAYVSFT